MTTRRIATFTRAALFAALATAALGAQAANMISDGGFEGFLLDDEKYRTFLPATKFGEWIAVGTEDVAVVASTLTQDGIVFPAKEGQNWLDLTGLHNASPRRPSGVVQYVGTVFGQRYNLTFWIGNVRNKGQFGRRSKVDVYINGQPTRFEHTGGVLGKLSWKRFSHTFTAFAEPTEIKFMNADPSTDFSNGLDEVTLTHVPD